MPVATLGEVQKHWIFWLVTKMWNECGTKWLRVPLHLEPADYVTLELLPFKLQIFDENVEIQKFLDVKSAVEKKVACMWLSHLCVMSTLASVSCFSQL